MKEEKKSIEIKRDTKIRTNPNFILREIAGESILVPLEETGPYRNMTLTLNETAVFLWKIFMEGATVTEACNKVMAEYTSESENDENYLAIMEFVTKNIILGLLLIEEQTE